VVGRSTSACTLWCDLQICRNDDIQLESVDRAYRVIRAQSMPLVDSSDEAFPGKDFDPDKLSLLLRVTLSANRSTVDPVVQEVMAVVRQMKGVDGKEDAIELSLQEALANAVIHGAKEDPTKTVECLVSNDDERGILIVVRDPGAGFSPETIPVCTVGENVYSNHGRGIFLINQLMDKVEFRKNGTEIHMVKR
jgi:serine/threonine-protein kinase RsbW